MTGFLDLNSYEPPSLSGDDGCVTSFHPVMTGCKVGLGGAAVELAAGKLHFDSEYAHSEPCRSDKKSLKSKLVNSLRCRVAVVREEAISPFGNAPESRAIVKDSEFLSTLSLRNG